MRSPDRAAFSTTVLDLAEALAKALDGPKPEITGGFRAADVRHVVASPRRARAELGFTAETAFQPGMTAFAPAPLRA